MIQPQNRHTSCTGMSKTYMGRTIWTKAAFRWFPVEKELVYNLLKDSKKTMMMVATKDTSLRLILGILSVYIRYTVVFHFRNNE